MSNAVEKLTVDAIKETPALVFGKDVVFADVLKTVETEFANGSIDLSTAKGRDSIKSRAYSVAKIKTAIDGAGKELNAEKRKELDAVDAVRRMARSGLDDLRDKIRKPLDDWEAQEQARLDQHKATLQAIIEAANVPVDEPSQDIMDRINRLKKIDTSTAEMQEFSEQATERKNAVLDSLGREFDRAQQSERDRAELEELRKKQAEQEAREAQERAAREAAERAAEAERQRALEAERIEREKAEAAARAAEQAKREAEEKAERERQAFIAEQERKEQARLAAELEAKQKAELKAMNKRHRAKINKAAIQALMEAGRMDEPQATQLVAAIAAGEIPHVTINY